MYHTVTFTQQPHDSNSLTYVSHLTLCGEPEQ